MAQAVLIIDDDWMNRELAGKFLEREGFTILHASSGTKGIEVAQTEQPAAILCDVRLGDLDGYEVVAALNADARTRSIPVIILTAYENEAERRKAEAVGAADFISKMSGMSAVVQRVKALLAAGQNHD